MQHVSVLIKLNFDPNHRDRGGGGLQALYLRPCCCIHDDLDMQHDVVLKKLNIDLLTPWVKGRGGQNICYHVATFCGPI